MMEKYINKEVRSIEISGIRKFYNMITGKQDIVSLTLGQPDFPTPDHIKQAAKDAIDNNLTRYTHNAGAIEVREAASSFVKNKYGQEYDPNTEVIITAGTSEAIDITFRTILSAGDEVILPAPVYPGYEPIIRMCGAIPVHVDTGASSFKLTAETLEHHITPRTRCVVLPYPSNPTGTTLNEDNLCDIAEVLSEKDILVLSDELYSELIFEGEHHSIASIPNMRAKTIVVNGLSKSHSMTGWRIGFIYAPESIAKHILKVHQYNVTCASSISQYAAREALTKGINDALPMRAEYKERLHYVYNRLLSMDLKVHKPNGAFYIFPSISDFGMSSFDFALDLVEKERVAVIPGNAFGSYGEGFIRISYAYSMEILKLGLDRIESYLKTR